MPGVHTRRAQGELERLDGAKGRLELVGDRNGAPIFVDGRIWGFLEVGSRYGPLPDGTEDRMTKFTELVGTAIANAETRPSIEKVVEKVVLGKPTDMQLPLIRAQERIAKADARLLVRRRRGPAGD